MSTFLASSLRFAAACLALLVLVGCKDKPLSADPASQDLREATLASLGRVADYPLYRMTYYGDYGFGEYLRTGTRPTFAQGARPVQLHEAWGCTCFAAMGGEGETLFGRNFDWQGSIPLVLFTHPPGGYASVSIVDLQTLGYGGTNLSDAPHNRTALLDAPFLPFDGMNEKGVAVGMMAVDRFQAPQDPEKRTINQLEAMRLVLDYASSAEEAIALIGSYNMRVVGPPLHFLVADREGHSAVIEFVGGRMEVLRNTRPWQVCTNFIITGSTAPASSPCWRYNAASKQLVDHRGALSPEEGLSLLQQVSQSNTIWSNLYTMKSLALKTAVGRQYTNVASFALDASGHP